ncbi:MAG TPA: pentapeptide repeat-containing protein [Thermoanaerobaculia bacterium]|nr:pentapeptide repeat-containing protein [Thermoanaerobaculia bacterium]
MTKLESAAKSGAEVEPEREGQESASGGEDKPLFDLEHFTFGDAFLHPFVRDCDRLLEAYAAAAGYSVEQRRSLQNEVHQRFVSNLKTLLSHGETREKFAALRDRMSLGTGDAAVLGALADHAEYQRWLFEEQPVFGQEPFTLAQVYQETDCGVLTWGEVRGDRPGGVAGAEIRIGREPVDPFSERCGGRRPLGQTVLELMGDAAFRDAIVIQGVAGAGKSAFTLWLCAELVRRGLRPIRVLLRDVQLDRGLSPSEALTRGIRLEGESDDGPRIGYSPPEDLLARATFHDSLRFGNADICPYVLILDGWDEISISVSEGFRIRVGRILESIRNLYVDRPGAPIRVILTGRPSADVTGGSEAGSAGSTFLKKGTPVLTVRPLRPENVEAFVARVAHCLERSAMPTSWLPFDPKRFAPALDAYRQGFDAAQALVTEGRVREGLDAIAAARTRGPGGTLEVLGLPLLLHLSVRLLASPEVDVQSAVENPTALFRGLVDLTCGKAGKFKGASDEIDRQNRIAGESLRQLLRWTAAAATILGRDSISFEELRLRLKPARIDLAERVQQDTEHSVLSQLMVSYYFKGGRTGLGCEFLHKSFREYLFAEGVIEILKEFGRGEMRELPEREPYWRDFAPADSRFSLSRDLSRWLAPQWLSPEVVAHLSELIEWETGRAAMSQPWATGEATEPLDLAGWRRVRDGLADLWDWWAEGVHLRPQSYRDEDEHHQLNQAYAHELVKWAMPLDIARGTHLVEPVRITVVDSHLGDALFQLTARIHYAVAVCQGWPRASGDLPDAELVWGGVSEFGDGPRRCQAEIRRPETDIRVFSPAGRDALYFINYVARINAAGWRPWAFPGDCDLRGIDLRGTKLSITSSFASEAPSVDLSFANIQGVDARGADLGGADLSFAFARHAGFDRAQLHGTSLVGANLESASFAGADLEGALLSGAKLRGAVLSGASLVSSDLTLADLSAASLNGADFTAARLSKARCDEVRLAFKALLEGAVDVPETLLEKNGLAPSEAEWLAKIFGFDGTRSPEDLPLHMQVIHPRRRQR